MAGENPNLSELLSSRICHDIVSPLGAIGNGMELLLMTGTESGPEITLILDSITNANARVRLFRIAFGLARADQFVDSKQARAIFDDIGRTGRIKIDWHITDRVPRQDAKLAMLAFLCLETALTGGGHVSMDRVQGNWLVSASAEKINVDSTLWETLDAGAADRNLSAAHVQFALLADELARRKRKIIAEFGDARMALRF
ncbi:MAG: histidine phosphotransferase [Rhodobacteraceae bacterium]|nr:histidine phosphotransferase [Paracoccaceae bacterium]MCP5340916.1 histidine phosphotransferase [Paracoccaceae bacterium]